jgi:hypothetical protein
MLVEIDSKKFLLNLYKIRGSQRAVQEFSEFIATQPDCNGIVFSLEHEPSPLLIAASFYHSCLRWVTEENISRKLSYEFLICLTGLTQIQRLIEATFKSNKDKNLFFLNILTDSEKTQEPLFKGLSFDRHIGDLASFSIKPSDRSKLAGIQEKLLSKLS